nr:type I-B CRISPR-associated protein Cas7/Cst2/DevR [Rubrobacteraceae bacterium]
NVAPSLVICAVTKGGNNPFGHVMTADSRGKPQVNAEALEEALDVFADQLLSPVYVGWIKGFMDGQRTDIEGKIGQMGVIDHPRRIFERVADDFAKSENSGWLE